jgi:hypothetical protein
MKVNLTPTGTAWICCTVARTVTVSDRWPSFSVALFPLDKECFFFQSNFIGL